MRTFASYETVCHNDLSRFNTSNGCMRCHQEPECHHTLHPGYDIVRSDKITSNIPVSGHNFDAVTLCRQKLSHRKNAVRRSLIDNNDSLSFDLLSTQDTPDVGNVWKIVTGVGMQTVPGMRSCSL